MSPTWAVWIQLRLVLVWMWRPGLWSFGVLMSQHLWSRVLPRRPLHPPSLRHLSPCSLRFQQWRQHNLGWQCDQCDQDRRPGLLLASRRKKVSTSRQSPPAVNHHLLKLLVPRGRAWQGIMHDLSETQQNL
jgi:hypothetical protein